ncbi:MAG: hypothetical protein ABSG97_07030 [Sedimentisphaerales bacterium]|jgi:hypothetical protein
MEIVVNEWLLEYLRPDAQESDRIKVSLFINAFVCRGDKIIIKRNSPFTKKFYGFWKQFESDTSTKKRFTFLNNIFRNLDKTIIIYDHELKVLPENIAAKTPSDDKYLIELWYSNQERIVLTTDIKLKDKLKDIPGLKICLLPDFLKEYLA